MRGRLGLPVVHRDGAALQQRWSQRYVLAPISLQPLCRSVLPSPRARARACACAICRVRYAALCRVFQLVALDVTTQRRWCACLRSELDVRGTRPRGSLGWVLAAVGRTAESRLASGSFRRQKAQPAVGVQHSAVQRPAGPLVCWRRSRQRLRVCYCGRHSIRCPPALRAHCAHCAHCARYFLSEAG